MYWKIIYKERLQKKLREANVDLIKDDVSREVEQEVERRMKKLEEEVKILCGKLYQSNDLL